MIAFFIALTMMFFYVYYYSYEQETLALKAHSSKPLEFSPLSLSWLKLFSRMPPRIKVQQSFEQSKQIQISLMLKPKRGKYFDGTLLKEAFAYLHLTQGEEGFVHKRLGLEILYSICHLYHPGTFSYHQLEGSFYTGLLFVFIPTKKCTAKKEFNLMLKDFNKMAIWLSAYKLDENAELLTERNIEYLEQLVILQVDK
jgi:FtsZ-interacting cell division protein ZipA